ncbi:MAG: alanine--tRNA ligase [Verrucomicrobiales bacterium]|nr:alanine--tRNA ligase [Verrucomicrobiales bacterium]
MTSAEIRQSFLDFFKSKEHTTVSSSSLMPDAPNLLFTNAGMNQFVPIFLEEKQCPYSPGRAADTQKCIRAGGKHNDLEDVGLDTYHHTFFEMLGNWSFGDYFKKEAIEWSWELVTGVWKFPKERMYATVYKPGEGDPADFDQEAYDFWKAIFEREGLDPEMHIVYGNKKDNFWMMGETGPCGPCSELHMDLTQNGDTGGRLVNADSSECIEIWNLVFIQFNANADSSFSPLPAKHIDTGMGFERVASIIQCTQNFSDFGTTISNYETDIFRPIFDELEKLSGKKYTSTLPRRGTTGVNEQQKLDVAFRVIADHIRTLSFSIADGIQPGNTDRNYVLRRILRRAVRYGRTLGFHEPFFYKLVQVVVHQFGKVFPELAEKQKHVEQVIRIEEESFNKTLDRGIVLFEEEASKKSEGDTLDGDFVFKLYDTYGFPLDLTDLMARERKLLVDSKGFEKNMEAQRQRARESQKKEVVELSQIETTTPTAFSGFDDSSTSAKVLEVVQVKDKTAIVLDSSVCYAEMGGQLGDTGEMTAGGSVWKVRDTTKTGDTFLHFITGDADPVVGQEVQLSVDQTRRAAIQRHHTVTHLFHWALHEVVSREASQKGSYVGPEKLTFDFNCAPLTPQQVLDVERLVNERILENAGVSWSELPYAEVKENKDVMQFFGDKYGDIVRVVQIGGEAGSLNGYSMELCGGTHTRSTGEIGLFRIVNESAIAAGVRRVEAIAGLESLNKTNSEVELIKSLAGHLNSPIGELAKKVEALVAQQKKLEKQLKGLQQAQAAAGAKEYITRAKDINGVKVIAENLGDADGRQLQAVADALKGSFEGVVFLGGSSNGSVGLLAMVSPSLTSKVKAGDLIKNIAPIVGGRGGGKPELARGGGKDAGKLNEAIAKVADLIG